MKFLSVNGIINYTLLQVGKGKILAVVELNKRSVSLPNIVLCLVVVFTLFECAQLG